MSNPGDTILITKQKTARRESVSGRTIDRWVKDPELGFPKPFDINGRKYFRLDELEAWERSRAAAPSESVRAAARERVAAARAMVRSRETV
jgi:hypothetical protein